MNTYIVAYDLYRPGQNYPQVDQVLEAYGSNSIRILRSTWLVRTNETAVQLRDKVWLKMDINDKIYVGGINGSAWHITDEVNRWIKK